MEEERGSVLCAVRHEWAHLWPADAFGHLSNIHQRACIRFRLFSVRKYSRMTVGRCCCWSRDGSHSGPTTRDDGQMGVGSLFLRVRYR